MIKQAQPGDTVELKDKETGFYDDETKFKVTRDEQVKLGSSIGRRTNEALISGGLLVVGSGKGKGKSANTNDADSDLPEDFPGREAFAAAGMDMDAVRNFDFEKDKVPGVGAATVKSVGEYLSK